MAAIPVSLANSEIRLPLEVGAFHVHMTIPFSLIRHFDPSTIQCKPRNPWVARLFGQGYSLSSRAVKLAIRHLRQISQQLSGLLFGREEPVQFTVASCDADNWEHLSGSNFYLTFLVGAEDNGNARVLVFEANEKLVQGSIHFFGEELGEKEKAAWTAGWMNLVMPYERPDSYSTPLEREMLNKNRVLHRHYKAKVPSSLDEKESPKAYFARKAKRHYNA
jgi:hypothetical protein